MASYRLTTAAANDLMEIARYGDERFGVAQSDAYRDQLKAHFSRLAQQPKLFAAVDDSELVTVVALAACTPCIFGLKVTT